LRLKANKKVSLIYRRVPETEKNNEK